MYPRWTKLKVKLESCICNSLQGRVHYHLANYRKSHDQMGRAFIVVDQKEVFNMCSITADVARCKKEIEICERNIFEVDFENIEMNRKVDEMAQKEIEKEMIFAQWDFLEYAKEFLNMPIEDALVTDNILIRIFAIIDKRVGKRTLRQMKVNIESEQEIIQYFFNLRCEAEGIIFV